MCGAAMTAICAFLLNALERIRGDQEHRVIDPKAGGRAGWRGVPMHFLKATAYQGEKARKGRD